MQKNDINDIVLIGGSTRIPKIRDMLKNYFGKGSKISINPDEAVAYGAAIQAAKFCKVKNIKKLDCLILVDFTPLIFGIKIQWKFNG